MVEATRAARVTRPTSLSVDRGRPPVLNKADGVSPQDPEVRARWRTVIKANARKFLLADGIAISVQFLAGVHGSRERPASATASS